MSQFEFSNEIDDAMRSQISLLKQLALQLAALVASLSYSPEASEMLP